LDANSFIKLFLRIHSHHVTVLVNERKGYVSLQIIWSEKLQSLAS
jgi:hypothetical protein